MPNIANNTNIDIIVSVLQFEVKINVYTGYINSEIDIIRSPI